MLNAQIKEKVYISLTPSKVFFLMLYPMCYISIQLCDPANIVCMIHHLYPAYTHAYILFEEDTSIYCSVDSGARVNFTELILSPLRVE